jgi:hypothetical protein
MPSAKRLADKFNASKPAGASRNGAGPQSGTDEIASDLRWTGGASQFSCNRVPAGYEGSFRAAISVAGSVGLRQHRRMIEHHFLVPAGLRTQLEAARLENLALMLALDRGLSVGMPLPREEFLVLGQLDADCAEALWALNQSAYSLNVPSMVARTLAALQRLPLARKRLRDAVPAYPQQLEDELRVTLHPDEAYSQVPGRTFTPHLAQPARRLDVGRNDLCTCGSARKYKKCCLLRSTAATSSEVESVRPAGLRTLYYFEPGSYGDKGAFVPSIACEKEDVDGTRVLHFILVKPQIVYEEEAEAVAEATKDLQAAFSGPRRKSGFPEGVALVLRSTGYAIVEGGRIAKDARAVV